MATIPFSKARERMMADPEFRQEYDALEEEFALIEAMIGARTQANMRPLVATTSMTHTGAGVRRTR